ncbi:hypothetical protein ACNTMW_07195 [Planosporangium sp. 12N6]|uniref:hypothetical protein n=1 Tax=Planosporangium spinosum TaxID=3402278 RepID=UPI003CE9A839
MVEGHSTVAVRRSSGRGSSQALERWVPPLLALVAGNLLFWFAARRHGFNWLDAMSRARYDTFQYLSIAQHGYRVERCPAPGQVLEACGNIGWFPLYPLLLRAVHLLGGWSLVTIGAFVAEVALLGALIAVWHLLGARVTGGTVACLTVAAAWPGAVYYHAIFPIALSVLLALVAWWLLDTGQSRPAGIAGLLATMTYGISVLIAPAMLLYLFLTRTRGSRAWLREAAETCGLTCLGVVVTGAVMWYDTGRFTPYLDFQRRVTGGRLHNPVESYRQLLDTGRIPYARGTGAHPWPTAEIVSTLRWELRAALILLVAAVLVVAVQAIRRSATALDIALVGYGILMFTAPLVIWPHTTQVRAHALMMPMVLVFRHLPAALSGVLAAGSVVLAYALGALFVLSSLV